MKRSQFYTLTTRAIAGLIGLFSPYRAARYYHGRAAYQQIRKRGYLAASASGPNQLWNPTDRTADAEIRRAAPKVRARARDLERNNPNLAGAIGTIIYNVIGTGIIPQADIRRRDGTPDSAANEAVESLWARWSDEGCDLSGEASMTELMELTLRHLIIDGEIFHHFVIRDYLQGVLPLRIEPLEADQIDSGVMADNVMNGIEYNNFMRKTAFYVFENSSPGSSSYQSRRVPARDMLHIYHKRRASQYRGISWLAPIIMRMYDLAEYEDYEMVGAKLAAAFGIFIETPFSELPGGTYMSDKAAGDGTSPMEYIEPGRIQRLMPGEKISVASHNRPGSNYDSFVASMLRSAASGLNLSYEAVSKDYSRATYASARSATLEERRFYRWCQQFLIRKLCMPIYRRFVETAILSGSLTAPGYVKEPNRYLRVKWQTPGWEWVDPLKDSRAAELELKLGITSRRELAWQRGRDLDQIMQQLAAEEEQMASLGIGEEQNDTKSAIK